jgi:hypothetical protein
MQRRDFLGAGLAGAAAAGGLAGAAGAADGAGKQVLELRFYTLTAGAQRERFEKFLAEAAIPAWNRIGVKPVGVFAYADGKSADLIVLLPHDSAEAFVTAPARLWADEAYRKAGEAVLDAPKGEPAYQRIETCVMLAFDGIPKVEVPTTAAGRVLQLRIYESHSDLKAVKKIDMFEGGGEMALFRKVGMPPVFFGQAIGGTRMPNLTYMLSFADEAAQKAGWDAFLKAPEWDKMKNDPQYKDTVSNITNLILKPAAGSQV